MKRGTPGTRTGLRVVFDTNVYVSMFTRPESRLFLLWLEAREHRYRIVVSPWIIQELGRILRHRFAWMERDTVAQLKLIARSADIVIPQEIPDAVPDDPDDNHVLACAVAGRAGLIVSGDKDLLRLKEFQGIPIVRPMDFLRTLGS